MQDIITLRIDMTLLGRMTQLPDSQKIFGALMYMLSDHYSTEDVAKMVSDIREGDLYVAVSNMLPFGYFPTPQVELLNRLSNSDKETYKAVKQRSYIPTERLLHWMQNADQAKTIFPYIHVMHSQQIHASIDSIRYHMPGLDPNLYSVPEVNVLEIHQNEQQSDTTNQVVKQFSFYLSVDNKGFMISELRKGIRHAQQSQRRFFLGPRASQGLNTFVVNEVHEVQWDMSTRKFLNLGMLLPNHVDFQQSALKVFTSERNPYHVESGWDKSIPKQFISFIEAGSIVVMSSDCKSWRNIGRSIRSPFRSRDIVFGNACLYPLLREGGT